MKRLFSGLAGLLLLGGVASAQTYSGSRAFDGVHKNEISGHLTGGYNVISNAFVGEAVTYTRHFTERWSIRAGQQLQLVKWLVSADVTGTYRLPLRSCNLYFDARILNNLYASRHTDELCVHVSAMLETAHFDMRLGASYIGYVNVANGGRYSELPTLTAGLGVNFLPRAHPWNIGLFLRNYDQYYYELWNLNMGLRFHCTLPWNVLRLFGEFNVRPAGTLSQLATPYETSLKLGLHYVL